MTTCTWGGSYLPLPSRGGISVTRVPIGSAGRMANGALRLDFIAMKKRIRISWEGLTATEATVLYNAWMTNHATPASLILPDGEITTVLSSPAPYEETQYFSYGDTPFYNVSLTFEQV